jgi:hypothetical protein
VDGRPTASNRVREFQTVHRDRHIHAGENGPYLALGFQKPDCVVGVASFLYREASVLDHMDGAYANKRLAFDDQNDGFRHILLAYRSRTALADRRQDAMAS